MNTSPDKSSQQASVSRQKLISAGTHLFSEHGFASTPVQSITDEAGVNKAMLYYYFGSKEELYDEIISEGIKMLEAAVQAAEDSSADIRTAMRTFLERYLRGAKEHPELAKIIFREAYGKFDRARLVVADHFKSSVRRLGAVIGAAQGGGGIRSDIDPVYAAYSLFGMANMFISRHVVTSEALETGPLIDHITDQFFRGAQG